MCTLIQQEELFVLKLTRKDTMMVLVFISDGSFAMNAEESWRRNELEKYSGIQSYKHLGTGVLYMDL
ncbi:hypothetical protein WKI11_01080 [Enterococcus avium]|jgi:hypothetical protein|uniref:hypothetical protein n=1 Tax=Enterococcus avium TaxID=33945 RepID=UPI000FD6B043|nr:hypothetical protein [Enterococcus avium]MDT2443647.1 hypothetical protein [Enterococcus avium]DAM28341.1 MAG TPA: hypothetical protein [Caudoviricetes sp.]